MTDLINRVDKLIKDDVNLVQGVVNKYTAVLQDHRPERDIPYFAFIIDICVNYLNENHKDLSADWKAWAVVVVRRRYLEKKLKKESDIPTLIDEFVEFWKSDYKKYCDDIISVSEYDRDNGFVYRFLFKKNR